MSNFAYLVTPMDVLNRHLLHVWPSLLLLGGMLCRNSSGRNRASEHTIHDNVIKFRAERVDLSHELCQDLRRGSLMWEWFQAQYSLGALWSAWGAIILGYAGFLLLERIIPAQRHPRAEEFAAGVGANLVFFLLNPVALFLGGWLSSPGASYLGGPRFRVDLAEFGPGPVTAFLLAFVPFFVFDLFYYWFHRFQHQWRWLWQVHRLHHSEAVLNVTTNYRHHWLEEFFRAFFIFLPMNWLVSIGPASSAVAAVLLRQWSSFFHANIRVCLGPLTGVVTGPQYHRIHHSIESKHVGKNYAAFFPVWDWIFGTYWRPARGEWPETGLPDTNGIWGLREVVLSPFVGWSRATRGRRRGSYRGLRG